MSHNLPLLGADELARYGLTQRLYRSGQNNAITDVEGVAVGHVTVIEGDKTRTGATAILPHRGNIFQEKVPAGFAVYNGFGKFAGSTQIEELGELETPILLTNTLATGRAIDALHRWTLAFKENHLVTSINAVVGETNDSRLNDIRAPRPTVDEMMQALKNARSGGVAEGAIGAGTGTVAFDMKGGIGTASRLVKSCDKEWTIGLLVQSNYGGHLTIGGETYQRKSYDQDGSIVMIVATDAPLDGRQLKRLASRAFGGLARTGAALSNGSGDYALAFSTAKELRRINQPNCQIAPSLYFPDDALSPLFEATIEATEEAIIRSLLLAKDMHGYNAKTDQKSFYPSFKTLIKSH